MRAVGRCRRLGGDTGPRAPGAPTMDERQKPQGRLFQTFRRLVADAPLTARRAAVVITLATLVLTVIGGIAIWIVDDSFSSLGEGLWWSVQTLTTVGYGDIVPESLAGRLIATLVMLNGIAFLTVITAAVTAVLIDQLRVRHRGPGPDSREPDDALTATLEDIRSRLDSIEASLRQDPRR
jgi:voltage-gated potassium channel